jgi:predicted dehydrogenase
MRGCDMALPTGQDHKSMSQGSVEPVRIGVIGLGSFGSLHARTLLGIAEAELVAIVDSRSERFDQLDTEFAGISRWDDFERAIEESQAEAWVVASSTASHVAVTERILSRGFSALVEKPLAQSLSSAKSLGSHVHPDSSNLMMGHIVLFNTEFERLVAEVHTRPALTHISCTRHRPAGTPDLYPGENPFHLLMVHDLYSVLALVDRREPIEFSAQVRRRENGIIDLALAQLSWEDGLVASFSASFLTPIGMADDGYDRMEVYGPGWAARIDPNPRPFTVWDDRWHAPLTHEIVAADAEANRVGVNPIVANGIGPERHVARGMLAEELRCFCRVVRGASRVPVGASYEDALTIERWIGKLEQCSGAT